MESKRKQCYERATSKNESGLFFVVGFFIVRNECLLAFWKLRCGTFSVVCFCFVKVCFFLLFCPLLTMAKPCASLNPCCGTCSVVCFCSDEGRRLFPFRFSHSWPRLNRVRLERDCNTIAFLRSLSLHTVNTRDTVISLASGFLSWHIPLWRRDMFIIFRRRKLGLVFWENLFPLNELTGYVDLTVFHEIWSEHSLIDVKQNCAGEFLYFKYFPRGGL